MRERDCRGWWASPLTGRLLTAIQNWRQIYFGSIAKRGNGTDLDDYKKDGRVNLLKFAFGLNPTLGNVGQIPEPQRSGTNFVTTFTQPAGASGITYGAEWSPTLLNGSWTAIPDTGADSTHTFSLSIGTVPKLFMRLKVTNPWAGVDRPQRLRLAACGISSWRFLGNGVRNMGRHDQSGQPHQIAHARRAG